MEIKNNITKEIWDHHLKMMSQGIDGLLTSFDEESVILNNINGGYCSGVYKGLEGAKNWFIEFFKLFKSPSDFVETKVYFYEDIIVVRYKIDNDEHTVKGADTFLCKDGKFARAVVNYEITPK